MTNPFVEMIEQRVSVSLFDPSQTVSTEQIDELVRLATRAPTAFNLQNWRFIAVHTSEAKTRLRQVAGDQPKISEAAVTFIICGVLPDHETIADRLRPSVEAGFMPEQFIPNWTDAVRSMYSEQPRMQRDEAIRTATFAASTLMFAAQAFGLTSGAMVGFDADGVKEAFGLGADEVPVVLLAVGRSAPGNWPQKLRRPVSEVLELA